MSIPPYPYPSVADEWRTPDRRQTDTWNSLSIVALSLATAGLAGFFCCGVGAVTALAGAISGHAARVQIRRTGQLGSTVALLSIVIGWTGLVIGGFFVAWVAVAISHNHRPVACYFLPCDPG